MSKETKYIATDYSETLGSVYQYMDRFLKFRWLNHLVFWLAILITTAYHGSLFGASFWMNVVSLAFIIPVQVIATYLLVYYQLPRWLHKKRWWQFIIGFIAISFCLGVIGRLIIIYVAEPITMGDWNEESLWQIISDPLYLYTVYVPSIYLPAFIFLLIKMTKDRFLEKQRYEALLAEKRHAELSFLKAQMNPHFLFNTLNNIYSLANSESKEAPEAILKLSHILDYTLYDCASDLVPLMSEWELIENYTDLEMLRHGDRLDLSLNKNINEPSIKIAPLVLIALVENAFKYAVSSNQTRPMIRIKMEGTSQQISFEVVNSQNPDNRNKDQNKPGGIGVKNVKKQLDLVYPDRHSFTILETKDRYNVNLKIEL